MLQWTFFKKDFMYLLETEREVDTGRGRSRLHVGNLTWDWIPGLQDHTLLLGSLSTLFQFRSLFGFRHIVNCLVLIFTWISHWHFKLNIFSVKLIMFISKYSSCAVFSVSVKVFIPIQLKYP